MPKITPQNRKHPSASATSQRGVYAIFFVLLLTTIIAVVVMLGMEVNRIYSEHRDLQNQANAAAIAAASATQACGSLSASGVEQVVSEAGAEDMARDAAVAAGLNPDTASVSAFLGYLDSSGESSVLQFVRTPASQSNAVHVTLEKQSQLSRILPGWLANNTFTMKATATAKRELTATLSSFGTSLQTANDNSGLLNAILGAIIPNYSGLGALSLEGLTNTFFSVGSLLNDGLGINKVTDLLGLDARGLSRVLNTVDGLAGPLARDVLDPLVGQLVDTDFKLGDILDIAANAPVDAKISAYDFLVSIVMEVIKQKFNPLPLELDTGLLPLPIPNLAKVHVTLFVGQPPVIVVGQARQEVSDNGVEWKTRFFAPDINLAVYAKTDINLVLVRLKTEIPLAVLVGGGDGWLESASCQTGLTNQVALNVKAQTQAARVATGTIDDDGQLEKDAIKLKVTALDFEFFGSSFAVTLVDTALDLDQPVSSSGGYEDLQFIANLHDTNTGKFEPQTVALEGQDGINLGRLSDNLDLEVKLLGLNLGPILKKALNPVLDAVGGLVNGLGSALIGPVLQLLGLDLGSMNVTLKDVKQEGTVLVPGKIECVNC